MSGNGPQQIANNKQKSVVPQGRRATDFFCLIRGVPELKTIKMREQRDVFHNAENGLTGR